MKIRKYTAANTQEAIAKVKLELGGEALIISTKKVRQKGLFGFFKKPLIEMMAAIDEQAQAKTKRLTNNVRDYAEKNPQPPGSKNTVNPDDFRNGGADVFARFQSQLKSSGYYPDAAPAQEDFAGVVQAQAKTINTAQSAPGAATLAAGSSSKTAGSSSQAVGSSSQAVLTAPVSRSRIIEAYSVKNANLSEEAANLAQPPREKPAAPQTQEERISELESQMTGIGAMLTKVYNEVSLASKVIETEDEKLTPLTKVLRAYYDNLIRNEVEPEFSLRIIENVSSRVQDLESSFDAAAGLYNEVAGLLGKPETIMIRHDKKPTIAIFVGPTGNGKTTTLAKIAADSALNRGLDVAMITADTYRIAAVTQLKTYAEILGIPISVVYTPDDIKNGVAEFADKDLILIDTAGRSHRNRAQFDEIRELVKESEADEVFLVLSATTSNKNSREIIKNYDFLDTFKLIFTKADEAPVFGAMLNARMLTGKSLSYVTVSQSVPDDIEVANIDKITRNLIGNPAGGRNTAYE